MTLTEKSFECYLFIIWIYINSNYMGVIHAFVCPNKVFEIKHCGP